MCRFSDAGMTRLSTHCGGRRPKSAKARSRGKYGTRRCSECYGDRMLVAISMVDAAPARGDVHARMHVSPAECNGHLGGGIDGRHWCERRQAAWQNASTTFAFWRECCKRVLLIFSARVISNGCAW